MNTPKIRKIYAVENEGCIDYIVAHDVIEALHYASDSVLDHDDTFGALTVTVVALNDEQLDSLIRRNDDDQDGPPKETFRAGLGRDAVDDCKVPYHFAGTE